MALIEIPDGVVWVDLPQVSSWAFANHKTREYGYYVRLATEGHIRTKEVSGNTKYNINDIRKHFGIKTPEEIAKEKAEQKARAENELVNITVCIPRKLQTRLEDFARLRKRKRGHGRASVSEIVRDATSAWLDRERGE